MSMMAEIPLTALVPRATGPVATVYLLASPGGGRTAVLKVFPQPLDRQTYNGLEIEQAKLAGLRSAPSILLVDSIDELPDGRTGLRMEFCPQSLPDLVARGPLPIGDVEVLGQILASVLAQAHDIGLVHGGITPANVLERANGQPALGDFGLSLRLRFPRDLMGDAAYTAPEVLREGELSEQADVYGLGAVLYLALTGHSPFPARTGETPDDVVLRVLREPVPQVSGRDIPPGLTDLLLRMMAKEPGDRPDAAEVVGELEALLLQATEPDPDDLDFDDFRDELAAARVAQLAPVPAGQPVAKAGKLPTKRLPKRVVIAAAAAVALAAVIPVALQPWKQHAEPQPTTAGSSIAGAGTPTPAPAQAVQLELKPPKDNGTSVLLEWTSSKPLNYAVYIAEQGGQSPQTSYRGTGTSLTVNVTPGLKYCFEVQGTDGNAIYTSKPKPIRGATCQS
ncbi:MAG TPA: protein kinase [Kribbella sp.]